MFKIKNALSILIIVLLLVGSYPNIVHGEEFGNYELTNQTGISVDIEDNFGDKDRLGLNIQTDETIAFINAAKQFPLGQVVVDLYYGTDDLGVAKVILEEGYDLAGDLGPNKSKYVKEFKDGVDKVESSVTAASEAMAYVKRNKPISYETLSVVNYALLRNLYIEGIPMGYWKMIINNTNDYNIIVNRSEDKKLSVTGGNKTSQTVIQRNGKSLYFSKNLPFVSFSDTPHPQTTQENTIKLTSDVYNVLSGGKATFFPEYTETLIKFYLMDEKRYEQQVKDYAIFESNIGKDLPIEKAVDAILKGQDYATNLANTKTGDPEEYFDDHKNELSLYFSKSFFPTVKLEYDNPEADGSIYVSSEKTLAMRKSLTKVNSTTYILKTIGLEEIPDVIGSGYVNYTLKVENYRWVISDITFTPTRSLNLTKEEALKGLQVKYKGTPIKWTKSGSFTVKDSPKGPYSVGPYHMFSVNGRKVVMMKNTGYEFEILTIAGTNISNSYLPTANANYNYNIDGITSYLYTTTMKKPIESSVEFGEKLKPGQSMTKWTNGSGINFSKNYDLLLALEEYKEGLVAMTPSYLKYVAIKYPIKIGNKWSYTFNAGGTLIDMVTVNFEIISSNSTVVTPSKTYEKVIVVKSSGTESSEGASVLHGLFEMNSKDVYYHYYAKGAGLIKVEVELDTGKRKTMTILNSVTM